MLLRRFREREAGTLVATTAETPICLAAFRMVVEVGSRPRRPDDVADDLNTLKREAGVVLGGNPRLSRHMFRRDYSRARKNTREILHLRRNSTVPLNSGFLGQRIDLLGN